MKKNILMLTFFLLATGLFGQTKLLEKEVPDKFEPGKWGPNLRHYTHFYIAFDMFPNFDGEGKPYNTFLSNGYSIGYRYKLKLAEFYALGADIEFKIRSMRHKNDSAINYIPESDEIDKLLKHNYYFYTLGGSVFQRINYSKRGNYLGKYVDLGVKGGFNYLTNEFYKYEPVDEFASKIEVLKKNISGIEDLYWGVFGRIGFNKVAFTYQYRMSALLIEEPFYAPHEIGIELAF